MKGLIPIDIPTKKYIKAHIISELGEKPIMAVNHLFGNKLYDVLQHQQNERLLNSYRYDDTLKIFISCRTWRIRGAYLNQTNLRQFNLFIECDIKRQFRKYMDFYITILPSFEAHLPAVRKLLGIDLEAWSDDSMRKDYYRYRKYTGKPLLYGKVAQKGSFRETPENVPF